MAFPTTNYKGTLILTALFWFAFAVACVIVFPNLTRVLLAVVIGLLLLFGIPVAYQRRRSWLRFKLKTLLFVFTGVSVWFGVWSHRAKVQEDAVNLITEAGGRVLYQHEQPELWEHGIRWWGRREPPGPRWLRNLLGDHFFVTVEAVSFPFRVNTPTKWTSYDAGLAQLQGLDNLTVLSFRDTQITDADLMHLKGLTNLHSVDLANTQITDAGLVHLKGLTNLQRLLLRNTQVTDTGLVHLEGLLKLFWLDLGRTQVSDSGLAHLNKLTRLKSLWLNGTQVTDVGLVHLSSASNLMWLKLNDTQVTDAGLVHLKELTRLKTLFCRNTQITDAGIKRLRDELPNLSDIGM